MDKGDWWAIVHQVTKSPTWLRNWERMCTPCVYKKKIPSVLDGCISYFLNQLFVGAKIYQPDSIVPMPGNKKYWVLKWIYSILCWYLGCILSGKLSLLSFLTDILECEVKWALESITTKLVEVMEFQLSYFKFWKMMLWKCCPQYASTFGKRSSGHRTGKGQFSFQSQRKAMPKNA